MRLILNDLNLNSAERRLIEAALQQGGSIVAAAELLGVTRHAVKRRILKHRIPWPLSQALVAPATAAGVAQPPALLQSRPMGAADARAGALRIFSWFAALTPQRVWREEVAGALACIDAMQREGCSKWQIALKVWSTLFWLFLNGVREVVAGLTGRK